MDIDRRAPATAEGQIQIAASPDTVWSVLSDLSTWPSWNSEVNSISFDGPLEPGATFRWKSGSASLTSTLQVVDRPREIGWTGTTMGIKAVHIFNLEARDDGTRASSSESFRGFIPTVFRSYSRKILQRA